jgi:hypothetical protein
MDDVRVVATRVDRFSVSIKVEYSEDVSWWLTAVYGPTIDAQKPDFLDEMCALRGALAGLWSIADDFNMIADARDKNNANLNRRGMARFRALLNELELKHYKKCAH